ncbi:ATP-binding protein [Chitinophagaceae bacterium LWZ2-11]
MAEKKFPDRTAGVRYVDSIYALHPEADVHEKFKRLTFLCEYYYLHNINYKKAMLYADSMLIIISKENKSDFRKEEALAKISKADVLFSTKNYADAYTYYSQARIAAKESLDSCTYSQYSYRLGMIMYKKKEYGNAVGYFKEAFDGSKGCKLDFWQFYRRQEILNNTALSFNKSGKLDSALMYYEKALTYINENEPLFKDRVFFFDVARGVVYGNQGQIYLARHENDKAEALFKKSIEINSKPHNDLKDAQLTSLHLAHLYKDEKREAAFVAIMQHTRASLDTLKNDDAELDWNNLMWNYYADKKDATKAYSYLLHYTQLKDTFYAGNKKLNETDIGEQVKDLEMQYEMGLLRKDNKLQQVYLIVAAIFSIMAVIIIFLFIQNWKRYRKHIRVLKDLNERIRQQKLQLEQTLFELESQNKDKDRILRIVAHDLRNPIAAISSLTDMVLERDEYIPEQKELLNLVQNACNNSLELINEILEITIYHNPVSLLKTSIDLNTIVHNSVSLLNFKASEKGQHIVVETSGEKEIIMASAEKIWRVLSNLITNAIKFSPQGAIINVAVKDQETTALISVQDNGIGIPDSIKSKVFDMFTEAKRAGTSGEKPFGLGLSICKQIIDAHGGKIWFESVPGKGTIFFVELNKASEPIAAAVL